MDTQYETMLVVVPFGIKVDETIYDKFTFRLLNGYDQDRIISSIASEKNFLDEIFSSCIVCIESTQNEGSDKLKQFQPSADTFPKLAKELVDKINVIDRMVLALEIRKFNLGDRVEFNFKCVNDKCGKKVDKYGNLNDQEFKIHYQENKKEWFEFKMPRSKRVVKLNLISKENSEDFLANLSSSVEICKIVSKLIFEIDDKPLDGRDLMLEFTGSDLYAAYMAYIKYFESVGIIGKFDVACDSCKNNVELPIRELVLSADFFFPSQVESSIGTI